MSVTKGVSFVLGAMLALPVGLLAGSHNCSPATPTAESYTHDFAEEANQLLDQVQTQAYDVRTDADGLATLSRFNEVDWRTNSERLNMIRDRVNAMGESLCRLNQVRSALLPWQQQEIDRIMPALVELADSTKSAINHLNSHQTTFWATSFPDEMKAIYDEASRIDNTVAERPEYAKGPMGSSASTPSGK